MGGGGGNKSQLGRGHAHPYDIPPFAGIDFVHKLSGSRLFFFFALWVSPNGNPVQRVCAAWSTLTCAGRSRCRRYSCVREQRCCQLTSNWSRSKYFCFLVLSYVIYLSSLLKAQPKVSRVVQCGAFPP